MKENAIHHREKVVMKSRPLPVLSDPTCLSCRKSCKSVSWLQQAPQENTEQSGNEECSYCISSGLS